MDANEQNITNLADPVSDHDAATKKYVDDNASAAIHYIGELYGGGIVFWVDQTGNHGLIASLDDLDDGAGVQWGLKGTDVANCESMTDGASNTAAIISAGGAVGEAAGLCDNYTGGSYSDWYLPSNRELYFLASQDIIINYILNNDGDGATNGFNQEYALPTWGGYWSSTEDDSDYAFYCTFIFGGTNTNGKHGTCSVRAIRAF